MKYQIELLSSNLIFQLTLGSIYNLQSMTTKSFSLAVLFLLTATLSFSQKNAAQSEKDFYTIKTISIPEEVKLEVGGVAIMPDGRIAASTRRGEIWIIQNAYGTSAPHFTKFASGLHEVLGLAYRDGAFYCTQRGELTKIEDKDGDGRADSYTPITIFQLSGNYHEYAYGPVFDKIGRAHV